MIITTIYKYPNKTLLTSLFLLLLLFIPASAFALLPGGALGGDRPRILVSTDASQLASTEEGGPWEVDDHQSLVRFLLYSDMFDVEGIVHTAAISNRGTVETIQEVIDAYEQDYKNLKSWSLEYPTPKSLRAITVQGAAWAPQTPSSGRSTAGSQLIVEKANNGDSRPLWILVYGKITDVAQALFDDPSIKDNIRVIGSYQNFRSGGQSQPNDDVKAIEWVQSNHSDLYFIESLETLKATAFTYSGFTYGDSNRFMEENVRDHGALGNHMWKFRKQDQNGNPVSYTGWLRLGDDPTLNYLLSGDLNNPTVDHWGGRFQSAQNVGMPNYFIDLSPILEAHASGQKYHKEWLNDFTVRLNRARYFNELTNSNFNKGAVDWKFSSNANVTWATGHSSLVSTRAGKLKLSSESNSSIEQTISAVGGETYTLTGWLRPVFVTNAQVNIWGYWQTPSGEVAKKISGSFTSGNGAWAFVWQKIKAPIDATGLKIALTAGRGTGEVYFDDISIVKGAPPRQGGLGSPLLGNGDFTHGMEQWDGDGANIKWVTGYLGNSTKVGHLKLMPGTYPSISQSIPIAHEQMYTVTAWIKSILISGTTVKMWAYWKTPGGQVANSVSANFTSSSEWTYVWKQLVAPPTATELRISIEAGQGTGEAFIDEVGIWGP